MNSSKIKGLTLHPDETMKGGLVDSLRITGVAADLVNSFPTGD